MRILHVLSQFEVTGAEAYAVTLADEQLRLGHTVFVVSDTLTLPTSGTYIPMPVGKRSYPQRIRNVAALVRLLRGHSIDLLHAHSRAASWISWFAARLTGTAFLSTVHGRQHVHTSSKSFSVYGKTIIAVSPALGEHLINDLGLDAQSIDVIPNCISFDRWDAAKRKAQLERTTTASGDPLILFIGRLTGPKGDVARFLLTKVLPLVLQKRKARFHTLGGMITPEDIPHLASRINSEYKDTVVELRGFKEDVAAEILDASLVIGSGRVIPESLTFGKPAVAFGESTYEGPLTPATFGDAMVTNFGDTGVLTPANPADVARDLLHLLEHPPAESDLAALAELARQNFDSRFVVTRIHRAYEAAIARAHSPRSIPVLMYHRVLPASSAKPGHGIWVSEDSFARQLESLRSRGFDTITFREYAAFLRAERKLPSRPVILTFDDGYVDNYTTAFPLLQKFGFRAVIFAVTDKDRRTNFWDAEEHAAPLLSDTQLAELHRHGIEIGSHTVTHPRLTEQSESTIEAELLQSKARLEQVIGSDVLSFAYPYGAMNERVKRVVGKSGYKFAVAADSGPTELQEDFLEIRRTQVFPWTSKAGFWKKSLPLYYRYKRMKEIR